MSSNPPPELLRRWESLSAAVQAAIVFPPLAVLLFLLNLGGFGQPLGRSILYGLIEAAPVTALALVATANERRKRPSPLAGEEAEGRRGVAQTASKEDDSSPP